MAELSHRDDEANGLECSRVSFVEGGLIGSNKLQSLTKFYCFCCQECVSCSGLKNMPIQKPLRYKMYMGKQNAMMKQFNRGADIFFSRDGF